MDAERALSELTEISSQIELALIFDSRGELIGTTLADRRVAESLAFGATALFACTRRVAAEERGEPTQIELTYSEGSVLLVREGELRILAVASSDLIAGLAFFELRTCLQKLIDVKPKKRRMGIRRARPVAALQAKKNEHEATSSGSGKDADDTTL
jgi:predicted regulator of Ras-like GTPase activity (Roadblock/LC7/MglB family)